MLSDRAATSALPWHAAGAPAWASLLGEALPQIASDNTHRLLCHSIRQTELGQGIKGNPGRHLLTLAAQAWLGWLAETVVNCTQMPGSHGATHFHVASLTRWCCAGTSGKSVPAACPSLFREEPAALIM